MTEVVAEGKAPTYRSVLGSPRAVVVVAVGLILVQAAWRASIALDGFYLLDDFEIASRAATESFDWSYLSRLHAGHLMPGGLTIAWILDKVAPLSWSGVVVTAAVLQVAASLAVWHMLRTLFGDRRAILVPLAVYLFAGFTLDNYLWWTVTLTQVPLQLFMALAVTCHVRWLRDPGWPWLAGAAGSLVLALCFLEKSLFIVPLLFALTAWFYVDGKGPVGGIVTTVRRDGVAWATYAAICVAYVALYQSRPNTVSFDLGPPLGDSAEMARDLIGATFVPGLFGGPWGWLPLGDTPAAFVDPPSVAKWVTWGLALAIVVVSLRVRRRSGRAWAILGLYLAVNVVLVAVGRLAAFGGFTGLLTRYVVDASVPVAIVLGLAFLPVVGERDVYTARAETWARHLAGRPRLVAVATAAALCLFVGSTVISTRAYARMWADNSARAWVEEAERSLAEADRLHPLLDERVPPSVLPPDFAAGAFRGTSRLLAPLTDRPVFGTYTDVLQGFDEEGSLEPATVLPYTATEPGATGNCQYTADSTQAATMALERPAYQAPWIVQLSYLGSARTPATIRLGSESVTVVLAKGLQLLFVSLEGGGDTVTVEGVAPGANVCIDRAAIGQRVVADEP